MTGGLLRRRLIFFGLNAAIALVVCFAILEPIVSHFAERNDDILDSAAQLAQIRRVTDEAAKLAKESMRSGKSIRQLARAKGVSEKELNRVLDLGKMTKPGLEGPGGGG